MAGLRIRVSTLPDARREELAGGLRPPAEPGLYAARFSSRSIHRAAPPISSPDSRAPFAAAVRETSR